MPVLVAVLLALVADALPGGPAALAAGPELQGVRLVAAGIERAEAGAGSCCPEEEEGCAPLPCTPGDSCPSDDGCCVSCRILGANASHVAEAAGPDARPDDGSAPRGPAGTETRGSVWHPPRS